MPLQINYSSIFRVKKTASHSRKRTSFTFLELFLGNTGLKLILGYPNGLLKNRATTLLLGSISLSRIFVHWIHHEQTVQTDFQKEC